MKFVLEENREDKESKDNEKVLDRIGEERKLLNKPIESVIFWEEIASFMTPLKDN